MNHIVIIGNGIAGITAARHIRKRSSHRITVISGETDHFFSRTALMYIYMGHMKYEHTKPYEDWFWKKNRIDLLREWVVSINFDQKELILKNGENVTYDQLLIATGSKSNRFGWPGQDLNGVQGLYSYQDLELMENNTREIDHAVIVGGGLIGIEMAEMLHSRHIPVTFLVREKNFWDLVLPEEEAKLIERHIREYGIDLRLSTELEEITGDEQGRVKAVRTRSGETIACQFVGLTVGVSPNVDFLRNTKIAIDRGILVNEYLQTNIPDVYAAGDCVQLVHPQPDRKPTEPVWYTGRMMGETVARSMTSDKTPYDPGVWFNSAKFFDVEYQTYGHVWPQLRENEDSLYWEAKDGKKCVRIVFEKEGYKVLGMNSLGIRMRHEVWDRWISQGQSLKRVIQNLRQAFFDPEFYRSYEWEIQTKYHERFPDHSLSNKKERISKKYFGLI